MRRSWFIGLLVIVLLGSVGGFFYYQSWKHSPVYSLNQVASAVKQHDLPTFQKLFDIQSVCTRLVDQAFADIAKKEEAPNALAQGLLIAMKPQVSSTLQNQIKEYVEQGTMSSSQSEDGSSVSLTNMLKKKDEANLEYRGVQGVTIDGNIAMVTLELFQPSLKETADLDVKLRKMGGYWQVAELPNFVAFNNKIDDFQTRLLAEKNQPLLAQMQKVISVEHTEKSDSSDEYGFRKTIILRITVHNIGKKPIDGFSGILTAKNADGKVLQSYPVKFEGAIPAGEAHPIEWQFAANTFIPAEQQLFDLPDGRTQIEMEFRKVSFSDGSKIELLDS